MADDLQNLKRDVFDALEVGFQLLSSRLLLATREASSRDWRQLGRSVGRVKRELERYLDTIQEPELLRQVSAILSFEPLLEAQVKAHYLFARRFPGPEPDQDRLQRQAELLQNSSVASALARLDREEEAK